MSDQAVLLQKMIPPLENHFGKRTTLNYAYIQPRDKFWESSSTLYQGEYKLGMLYIVTLLQVYVGLWAPNLYYLDYFHRSPNFPKFHFPHQSWQLGSQKLDISCFVNVFFHHQSQEGRLGPFCVVNSSSIWDQSISFHHQQKVFNYAPDSSGHIIMQQGLHNPIGVPIVEFTKSA